MNFKRRKEPATERAITGKTARTLLIFISLSFLPHLTPGLGRYRIFAPSGLLGLWRVPPGESSVVPGGSDGPGDGGAASPGGREAGGPEPGLIEDPSGRALDNLFRAL
ncbi:MAG TPA: hypothetical protein VKC34_17340, partial [Blastocatellia bacterium]|nr:hypothetical protein [Blastocatellia bacterium]